MKGGLRQISVEPLPLQAFEIDKIEIGLKSVVKEWDPVSFLVQPVLEFKNSDRKMVRRLDFVLPVWE